MHLDIVFKAFVGVLAAIVLVGSGLGIITGFSQAVAADNYMESVSKVIVESNYNEEVIDKCIEEAASVNWLCTGWYFGKWYYKRGYCKEYRFRGCLYPCTYCHSYSS